VPFGLLAIVQYAGDLCFQEIDFLPETRLNFIPNFMQRFLPSPYDFLHLCGLLLAQSELPLQPGGGHCRSLVDALRKMDQQGH